MAVVVEKVGTLTQVQLANRQAVQRWLYLVLLMLMAIVLVGGATRMTGSGLSITEWKPIHGVIPPFGVAQWQEEFAKYQQIAQYIQLNQGMTLSEFQFIFWWEWAHRLLARLVGVVVFLVLLVFGLRRQLEKKVALALVAILLLIGVQGAIGWWMVYSGLGESDLTHVSQYRLAIHLVAACLTIMAVMALARGLGAEREVPAPAPIRHGAALVMWLILCQIYLGALVAGLHAGAVHNTWPLMEGKLIPDGLFALSPAWRNLFENTLTVQFIHRFFAYLLLLVVIFHALRLEKILPGSRHARRASILLALIVMQAAFGIITLLSGVPIEWGLLHQAVALLVLAFSVAHWRSTKGAITVASNARP